MEKITRLNASTDGTINDLVRSVNELIDRVEALERKVAASASHKVTNRINLMGPEQILAEKYKYA
jgi:flagellar hook-associated protein FlgK